MEDESSGRLNNFSFREKLFTGYQSLRIHWNFFILPNELIQNVGRFGGQRKFAESLGQVGVSSRKLA